MTLAGRSPSSPTSTSARCRSTGSPPLRRHHRAALPLLAPSFSRLRISADVVICSSSGWAHGTQVEGKKIVYCHTPARWLYQSDRYLRGRSRPLRAAAGLMHSRLERWDKRAAASADAYLANSTVVAERIKIALRHRCRCRASAARDHARRPGAKPMEWRWNPASCFASPGCCRTRTLTPWSRRFASLPDERLVIAGSGPFESALRATAGANVTFVGQVADAQLRWLYANCRALVAASYEDFGMTPLEAASFGKPTAALRWGGFLDTIDEGRTGVFFDEPTAPAVSVSVSDIGTIRWRAETIRSVAESWSERRFVERIRESAAITR